MRLGLLPIAVVLAMCAPALGEDCGKLRLITSIKLEANAQNTAAYVPVEIAGVSKLLLLDTNASMTSITTRTAQALGLQMHRNVGAPNEGRAKELTQSGNRREERMFADNGSFSDKFVLAPLTLGTLKDGSVRFMVAPEGYEYSDDARVAGVLGTDILQHFDVSIDFGTHELALIDQDHCKGSVVYWPADAVAIMPFAAQRSGRVVFEANLDGHPINAILDTGVSESTLYRRSAEGTFGLTLGSADTPASAPSSGADASTTWHHSFKTMTFDGVTVLNPEFTIIPNKVKKHADDTQLGSLIPRTDVQVEPDILLGMNVLKHLHLYIAYKEKNLYITPAGKPAPKPAN